MDESIVEMINPSPSKLAEEAFFSADGDWRMAADIVKQRLNQDESLFRIVLTPLVDQAIWALIRKTAHKLRLISCGPRPEGTDNVSGLVAMAKSIWNISLPGGILLRDATQEDLRKAVDFHSTQAKANQRQAYWFRLILTAMGKTERVKDCLTERQILELRDKARQEIG